MARPKKTETNSEDSEQKQGSIEDAFKVLDTLNRNASFLDDNSLSTVNSWIDTGSYALNAIISGSLYGGVPMGRLTGLIGPESCLTANQRIRVFKYTSEEDSNNPSYFEQNSVEMTIPEIIQSRKENFQFLVESPDGWVKIVNAFYNGDKDCLEISTKQGDVIECSLDHRFQNVNLEWVFAKDLSKDDILFGKNGFVTIEQIQHLINQPVYDIEVASLEHRYWCANMSNHNCGKTLLANKIMANAQKKGMHVAYFDTEGALDYNTAKRLGCDPSKIKHVPSEITEQCRNEIVRFFDTVIENNLQGKVLIVIDSVGNLITAQEKKKMDEGSETLDMGSRARACKSMMRAITHAAAKANCPIVFTNHIYDDPSQLHPSAIKKQAGGSGPLYMSSVIVQLAKRTEKGEDSKNKDSNSEMTLLSKGINGLTLRAFTTKNRFVTPFLEIEMYLNFKTGLNKYSGLLEMAEGYGVLQKQGHRYLLGEESLGFFKDFKDDEAVWNKILPELEKKLQIALCFNDESHEDVVADIENIVEEENKQD